MRLFVAVDPGERTRAALTPLLDGWRRRWDLKWVRPENLHVTLRFLGDWPDDRLPELEAALREGVRGLQPFDVSTGDLDVFPDWRRPRVLFLHLVDGGGLSELARSVSGRIDARFPDAGAAERDFRAHLTLARMPRETGAGTTDGLRDLAAPRTPGFRVDAVRLIASELRPDGARYAVRGVFPLARD